MSDLPYQPHEDTLNDARTRQYNGFTTDQIVAYAIAKEISLGRLVRQEHLGDLQVFPPASVGEGKAPSKIHFIAPAQFPSREEDAGE